MAEIIAPKLEIGGSPEIATRKEVLDAFNSATGRWTGKIKLIHDSVDPSKDIEDLDHPGLLSSDQKRKFADFITFKKGIRAITKTDPGSYPRLNTRLDEYSLNTFFSNPNTGEVYNRKEGLDISGLIESVKEDIETSEKVRFPSAWDRENLVKYRNELRILEENSVPFTEVFPDAFDESNPESKSRLELEARSVSRYWITSTGSAEGDWEEGKARLGKARLLRVPEKESEEVKSEPYKPDGPKEPVLPPEPLSVDIEEPLEEVKTKEPERSEDWIGEIPYVGDSAPKSPLPESFLPEPYPRLDLPPYLPEESKERSDREPELVPTRDHSPRLPYIVPEEYERMLRELPRGGESDDVVESLRGIGSWLNERRVRGEAAIARTVDTLMGVRIPDRVRSKLKWLVLPIVGILAASEITRESLDVPPPVIPTGPSAADTRGAAPPRSETNKGLEDFRAGAGLDPATFVLEDYSLRHDTKEKLRLGEENITPDQMEGYSIRGLTQSNLAQAMNPDLAQDVANLRAEGKPADEANPKLLKTLDLLQEKVDATYGAGAYDKMLDDFSQRTKFGILWGGYFQGSTPPVDGDKIVVDRVRVPQINDQDLRTWSRLMSSDKEIDPNAWEEIRDQITREVKEDLNNE